MTESPDLHPSGSSSWWSAFHRSLRQSLSPEHLAGQAAQTLPKQPCDLLVVGKAALPLQRGIRAGLSQVARSLLILPQATAKPPSEVGEHLIAEHPIPARGSFQAGDRVRSWLTGGSRDRGLVVGITGGTSALLAAPAPGLAQAIKRECHQTLLASGRSIGEINTVRRHLSSVKGGHLLRLASEIYGHITLMAVSDVPGDALHEIGSGPFSPDPTTFREALAIASMIPGFPPPALDHLERGAEGRIPETPKPGDIPAERFSSIVLAGADHARRAALELLKTMGFESRLLPFDLAGAPDRWACRLRNWIDAEKPTPGVWWAASGETEVAIPVGVSVGSGGRASTLLLHLGLELRKAGIEADLAVIATDGADGNSGTGGGFLSLDLMRDQTQFRAAEESLRGFDAAGFLASHRSTFLGFPGEANFGDLLLFRLR